MLVESYENRIFVPIDEVGALGSQGGLELVKMISEPVQPNLTKAEPK
jgi:hypothetical protein